MIKLMPTVVAVVIKNEMATTTEGKTYMKICIANESDYIWCAVFGATAQYVNSYLNIGAKVFLEEWNMSINGKYYDFTINKIKIIKNGDDK
ncbi:MAG: hypothetical protein ACRCX2_10880 [Paraclostridium sp.]